MIEDRSAFYKHPTVRELLALGIAVYRVGDIYDLAKGGLAIEPENLDMWFVSALSGTGAAKSVETLPLADTELGAWEVAASHYLGLSDPLTEPFEHHDLLVKRW